MADENHQPKWENDIADMIHALTVSSGITSQPPSPPDPPAESASFSSSSCFLPAILLQNNMGNPNYANYGFPSQQDYWNSVSAANFVAGGGFLPQQSWNMGYNHEAPVEWYDINPYAPASVGSGPTNYFPPANATTAPMVQNLGKERSFQASEEDPSILDKLTGQEILSLAKKQPGSRRLQRIITDGATAEKILDRLTGHVFDFMNDQYGKYLFQRLLFLCTNQEQFEKIVSELVDEKCNPGRLISLAKTRSGSLSIQNLLQTLKKAAPALIDNVISVLEPSLLPLMVDASGRYLIVDCLKQLNYKQNRPIFDLAVNNCMQLAEDSQGYHVIIAVVETVRETSLRTQILTMLTQNCVHLAQHPHGTFVMHKVIDLQNPSITENICRDFKPYIVKLSLQKSASRIIQKCLESSSGMEHLASELIKSDQLIQIANHYFGNHVILKILEISKIRFHHLYVELRRKLVTKLGMLQDHRKATKFLKYL